LKFFQIGRVRYEDDKIEANFKNGVLSMTLPKSAKAQQQAKKIEVKTG
jgi:HSP20 family protein